MTTTRCEQGIKACALPAVCTQQHYNTAVTVSTMKTLAEKTLFSRQPRGFSGKYVTGVDLLGGTLLSVVDSGDWLTEDRMLPRLETRGFLPCSA